MKQRKTERGGFQFTRQEKMVFKDRWSVKTTHTYPTRSARRVVDVFC